MTKKKLRIGALPKRQMPRKSHQSSQPTPRHERSVVKDVVEIPASTSFYSTFQEFSQRAKSLNTICDWMSKFSVDKAVFKKMTEPYMLPQFEIIVDDGLGFTLKVYGCYLVEDHPLYLEYRRSMQNVTMSNLVKDLEGYKLCNGVQTLELTSKLFHHVVPINFEYCNSLLIGIGKTLNKKLEDANHYGLRTIMNLGRSINYESILRTADMNTLEHRRIEQSLIIFYKCYKENGPSYLADLFEPRITPYNLRNTGLNVTQNSYNSKFRHNSYSFVISRIWNKLPPSVKTAPNLSSFRRKLKTLIFTGCQCRSCL